MGISFIQKETSSNEILEDAKYVQKSLFELKRSILNLGDKDTDNEVYHRYCDMEDEVINILDEISLYMKGETANEFRTKIS